MPIVNCSFFPSVELEFMVEFALIIKYFRNCFKRIWNTFSDRTNMHKLYAICNMVNIFIVVAVKFLAAVQGLSTQ